MDLSDIGPEFWDIDDLDVPTPVAAPPAAAVIRDLTKKKGVFPHSWMGIGYLKHLSSR